MAGEIEKILKNSSKAEMLEILAEQLMDAVIVVTIVVSKTEENRLITKVMELGSASTYESLGVLEMAKEDLLADGRR